VSKDDIMLTLFENIKDFLRYMFHEFGLEFQCKRVYVELVVEFIRIFQISIGYV
jgi:hypothetical protein